MPLCCAAAKPSPQLKMTPTKTGIMPVRSLPMKRMMHVLYPSQIGPRCRTRPKACHAGNLLPRSRVTSSSRASQAAVSFCATRCRMPPLSATDAITPAWQHTRRLLLGPRDPRLFFKIAAVAFFAELLSGTFSFSPFHAPHSATGAGAAPALGAAILAIIVVCAAVGLLIGLVFFYLSSRLQFTIFHVVLRSETFVAPIWRRYSAATWRWMGLKILLFLCAFACLAPILV